MGKLRALLPEKRRKDAVLAVEYVMTASPKWFTEATPEQEKAFFRLWLMRFLPLLSPVLNPAGQVAKVPRPLLKRGRRSKSQVRESVLSGPFRDNRCLALTLMQ